MAILREDGRRGRESNPTNVPAPTSRFLPSCSLSGGKRKGSVRGIGNMKGLPSWTTAVRERFAGEDRARTTRSECGQHFARGTIRARLVAESVLVAKAR